MAMSSSISRRKRLITRLVMAAAATFSVGLILLFTFYNNDTTGGLNHYGIFKTSPNLKLQQQQLLSVTSRKLLGRGAAAVAKVEPNRMWGESPRCSKSDIIVTQGATAPLPNGIPTYTVEIMNVCVTGCDISRIHLTCGWFSSARLINPKLFKRLRYNDCLVNNGKPLRSGASLSFHYANTFRYPLSVSTVSC